MARRRTDSWRHQGDFSSGVIGRGYWGEPSSPLYQSGVSRGRNVVVNIDGTLERRRGTMDIGVQPEGRYRSRLISWQVMETQAALVWLHDDGQLKVLDAEAIGVSHQLVENSSFDAYLDGWTSEHVEPQSETGRPMLLPPTVVEPAYVRQVVTVPAPGADSVRLAYQADGLTVTLDADWRARMRIWHTTIDDGNLLYDRQADVVYGNLFEDSIEVSLPTADWTGDLIVQLSANRINDSEILIVYPGFVTVTATIEGGDAPTFSHPYSGSELLELQYVQNPYIPQLVICHRNHLPRELVYEGGAWAFRVIDWTGAGDPPWGAEFPAVCGSFQGRLVVGATESRPQTVWASRGGDWYDMDTGPDPDDALEFTLAYAGELRWVYGHKQLVIGTVNAEYRVVSSGGILVPQDIGIEQQSGYGSAYRMPKPIGHMIAFVQQTGTSIRTFDLRRDNEGWVSNNLSARVAHLISSLYGIFELAVERGETPALWVAMNTRTVLRLTFDPGGELLAWTSIVFSDFTVKTVAVHQSEGQDVVLFSGSVWRQSDAPQHWQQVRAMTTEGVTEFKLDREYYMDGMQEHLSQTPTTAITGLVGYEEGAEAGLFTDGLYQGTVVVTNGAATAPVAGTQHITGRLNTVIVETLPATRVRGGVGRGGHKGYSRAGVEMIDSVPPVIRWHRTDSVRWPLGLPDQEPGQRLEPAPEQTKLQSEADPNQSPATGLFETEVHGVNVDGSLEVSQDWPVPLRIVSIYQKIDEDDL